LQDAVQEVFFERSRLCRIPIQVPIRAMDTQIAANYCIDQRAEEISKIQLWSELGGQERL
jgi:hypothetical protein